MKDCIRKINELKKELNALDKRMKGCTYSKLYDLLEDERQSIVWDIKFYAEQLIRCCDIDMEIFNDLLPIRINHGGVYHGLLEMTELRESRKTKVI